MLSVGQGILSAHVKGACLVPTKQGALPVVSNTDVECGCISALVQAAESESPENGVQKAGLMQFAAKGLVFANRFFEAIPLAARALRLFEKALPNDPLAAIAAKADLALALACMGQPYGTRARELWADVDTGLAKHAKNSADAQTLAKLVECDKSYAAAINADTKQDRVKALQRAFVAAVASQHPFLMRIIGDLEQLDSR